MTPPPSATDGPARLPEPDAPALVQAAFSQLLRWMGRSEVRERFRGGTGDDLSATDLWVLGTIADAEPVRSSVLAAWQGVDKSTVAAQVRRLVERGLVERAEDGSDRRAALLSLTAAGRSTFAAANAARAAVVAELLSAWSQRDRDELARLLTRLSAQLPGRGAAAAAPPGPAVHDGGPAPAPPQ